MTPEQATGYVDNLLKTMVARKSSDSCICEDALRNADSINELKLNIKLNSKRARTEKSGPTLEPSVPETEKEETPLAEVTAKVATA